MNIHCLCTQAELPQEGQSMKGRYPVCLQTAEILILRRYKTWTLNWTMDWIVDGDLALPFKADYDC